MTKKKGTCNLIQMGLALMAIAAIAAPGAALAQIPLRFGVSPDNGLGLLLATIGSARTQLTINIYQLDHPAIVKVLTDKIAQGVSLQILVEGEPAAGGITPAGKRAVSLLLSALQARPNADSHVYLMTRAASPAHTRRYAFDHAKYIVIDGQFAFISSENFSTNGFAEPGRIGNRGWQVAVADQGLASQLLAIFAEDSSLRYGDVEELGASAILAGSGELTDGSAGIRPVAAVAGGEGAASNVSLITSPHSQDGLVGLIRSAEQTLRVEFMEIPLEWKTPNAGTDPLVTEVLAAARRGVHVHVLLNDESAFNGNNGGGNANPAETVDSRSAPVNPATVDFLNQTGLCEHLDLSAAIVDLKRDGIDIIHNKGIIVDQSRVLVSSINGTENSIFDNREVAIVLESPDAAQYFSHVFDFDWSVSAPNPGVSSTQPCHTGSAIPYWLSGRISSLADFFVETRGTHGTH